MKRSGEAGQVMGLTEGLMGITEVDLNLKLSSRGRNGDSFGIDSHASG